MRPTVPKGIWRVFITDGLTEKDLINYAYTIRDKMRENETVMNQIANNSAEQALLGDFVGAMDDAVIDSATAPDLTSSELTNCSGTRNSIN